MLIPALPKQIHRENQTLRYSNGGIATCDNVSGIDLTNVSVKLTGAILAIDGICALTLLPSSSRALLFALLFQTKESLSMHRCSSSIHYIA
jgi:hypothetical protein